MYVTWGKAVNMECDVQGEKKEVVFEVSEDQRTLSNPSESSTYSKIDARPGMQD